LVLAFSTFPPFANLVLIMGMIVVGLVTAGWQNSCRKI
jgi:hypothetical protein